MGKKVYIVTSGEYSDYHIEAAFSTKKQANDYLDQHDDDFRIETFDLDVPFDRKTMTFCISLNIKNKSVVGVTIVDTMYERENEIRYTKLFGRSVYAIKFFIKTDSQSKAIKIASERFGAVIANEQTMYPFLRQPIFQKYGEPYYPIYDFNTGEIVIYKGEGYEYDLPEWVKVRYVEPQAY